VAPFVEGALQLLARALHAFLDAGEKQPFEAELLRMRLVQEILVHLLRNPQLNADCGLPHRVFPGYTRSNSQESQFVSTIIALQEKILPGACYLFKHSTTCPVSAHAAGEIRAMRSELPIYWVNVREQRDLSNWVAEQYGVRHESPQLILLRDGKPEKVWNHFEITRGPR
jgi:bacillithiol system protein YtxJ